MGWRRAFWVAVVVVAAVIEPSEGRAEAYRFRKGPYLQGLTSSGVSVRWEGSEGVGGSVEVTGPDGKKIEAKTEEKSPFHAVEVAGLKPATAYSYVVRVGDVVSAEGKFVTAPEETRPFTFLLYGDNRTDLGAHSAVVKAMQAVPSDFLLNTGDMVASGDSAADWEAFFQVESPMLRDRCLFTCVGNHEMTGSNAINFLRFFQTGKDQTGGRSLFFTTRWSNARFFFLNAFSPWGSGSERAWLEQELTKADSEPGVDHRFVVMHHGPSSSGPHGSNREFVGAGLIDMMVKHKVSVVFAGHDHLYERGERRGLKYILSGGGGAPLYKPRRTLDEGTQALEAAHHFVEAKVDGPSLRFVARRLDGTAMESCEAKAEGWVCDGGLKDMRKQTPATPVPAGVSGGTKKGSCDCSQPGLPPAGGGWALLLALGGLLRRSARPR